MKRRRGIQFGFSILAILFGLEVSAQGVVEKKSNMNNFEGNTPFRSDIHYKPIMVGKNGLIEDDIAIFYSKSFQKETYYFPVFKKAIDISKSLPNNWELKPEFSQGEGRNKASIRVGNSVNFYGTGEVLGDLERTGKIVELWNTGEFKGNRIYQSHPYVMGVRPNGSAFGVIACSTYWGRIETKSGQIDFYFDGPTFPLIIIEGVSPQEVQKKLTALIGTIKLPPIWSIGFHQSRYGYMNETKFIEVANEYRKRKIPCDGLWNDIDYQSEVRNFTFNNKTFPDPKKLNAQLKEKGFHTVWIVDPYITTEPGYPGSDGTEKDYWVKNADGTNFVGEMFRKKRYWPDVSRPEVREWWQGLHKELLDSGIAGIWNDKNEPKVRTKHKGTINTGSFPLDAKFMGGNGAPTGDHRMYHNLYGMFISMASYNALKDHNPNRRPFVLTRSSFMGGQGYGAVWSGDNTSSWEHLRMTIPMIINLGLCGQPFSGADIPGFKYGRRDSPEQLELFKHWYALGAFYPFSRSHVWKQGNNHEPWTKGPEAEKLVKTSIERRYRLLPYYYTLFHNSSLNGTMIINPVFFADPSDLSLRKEGQAFLVGQDLLIVPKWAKEPNLPKGIWRPVSLVGEKSIGDSYLPDVKIRGGAIVPAGNVVQHTGENFLKELTLIVCLDEKGKAIGTHYEDAGDGYGYKTGDYLLTTYQAKEKNGKVTVTILKLEGKMERPKRKVVIEVVNEDGVSFGQFRR